MLYNVSIVVSINSKRCTLHLRHIIYSPEYRLNFSGNLELGNALVNRKFTQRSKVNGKL